MFCDLYSFVWIIPKGNKQTDYKNRKLVFDKHSIDTDSAVFLWNKIKDYRLYAFPTDTKINGWEHGYDGRTYVTEFSNDTILKYCYYWTPSAQNDTIKEAKVIREFYNLADSTLGVYKRFKQFTNSLPKGAYTWGMINMIKK